MDRALGNIQAYLGGLFDSSYDDEFDQELDPEDIKKYFGETTKISTFIDINSAILYKLLDEFMNGRYERLNPQMSSKIDSMVLQAVPAPKRNIIFPLFYDGLGFHPSDGPNDKVLHYAVFKMIHLYLMTHQNPSGSDFRPLHLAIDIVLKHKNKTSTEMYSTLGSQSGAQDKLKSTNIDFKFHAALKMTNYLLENGADPNEPDENGKTPLYRIADHLKKFLTWELSSSSDSSYDPAYLLFILFLRYGAEVKPNSENLEDDPFRIGLSYCSRTIVQLLIEHGYDLREFGPRIFPPRTCTAWFGLFELLARADVLDVESKDEEDGETLLLMVLEYAVSKSLLGEVEALVLSGSDVNAVDNEGVSVLSKAASIPQRRRDFDLHLYSKILRFLISHGAKAWQESIPWPQQPVCPVLYRGNWESVQVFLDETSENRVSIDQLKTVNPLQIAVRNKNREVFEKLLFEYKFDTEEKNIYGDITLHLTAVCEDNENADASKHYLDLLLAKGSDINSLNNDHETALHYAAERNSDMVQYLLSKGADVNIKTIHGKLPLDFAVQWRKDTAAKFMVRHIALLEKQGLHVEPENYDAIEERYNVLEYYQMCQAELELIQKSLVHESITFFDLLTAKKTNLKRYVSLVPVQNVFQAQNAQLRFPIYGEEIHNRFTDTQKELELLAKATIRLKKILKLDIDAFHLVYDNITSHLSEQDLSNLGEI